MNAYMLVAWNPNETVRVKHPRHGMWLERATVVRLCGSRYSLATHKRFQPTPAEVTTLQGCTDELSTVRDKSTINAPTKAGPKLTSLQMTVHPYRQRHLCNDTKDVSGRHL